MVLLLLSPTPSTLPPSLSHHLAHRHRRWLQNTVAMYETSRLPPLPFIKHIDSPLLIAYFVPTVCLSSHIFATSSVLALTNLLKANEELTSEFVSPYTVLSRRLASNNILAGKTNACIHTYYTQSLIIWKNKLLTIILISDISTPACLRRSFESWYFC